MRIVVFSDSHGNYFTLKNIVDKRPDADCFLHLGDGEKEFAYLKENYPDRMMLGVKGNCDWGASSGTSEVIVLQGKRIFFTHGHLYRVKSGLVELKREAEKLKLDIVLFGHTHEAMTHYEDGVYYMNPGSVSEPRNGERSYGIIDITPAGVVTFITGL